MRTLLLSPLCALVLSWQVAAIAPPNVARADDMTTEFTYRLTGLFTPDRADDFREVMKEFPDIKLIDVKFETSEAKFQFDPKVAFPGAKPEQILERFDMKLRVTTRATFGLRPVCTIPRDKLTFLEIPVAGLDCKACNLAAYEAVAKLDGVEQATASFKDRKVTAWIDASKTNRAALIEALSKKRVDVRTESARQKP